jgi:hypothetical protein
VYRQIKQVQILGLNLEVVIDKPGEFFVPVQSIASAFQLSTVNTTRYLKALLGEGYRFYRILIENGRGGAVHNNCIAIKDLGIVAVRLARRGNSRAGEWVESIVGGIFENNYPT